MLAHPARDLDDARERLRALRVLDRVIALQATTEDARHDRQFARAGWDLAGLARRYDALRSEFRARAPSTVTARASLAPQTAFVVRTLLVHEYRRIHLRDPLLPPTLLPERWVGADAYALCRELYAQVFAAAERHLSQDATHRTRPAAGAGALDSQAFWGASAGGPALKRSDDRSSGRRLA